MKPEFLGPEFGMRFDGASVAAGYPCRPPYPEQTFDALANLLRHPNTVLEVGAGTGEIARRLVHRSEVERVDALDPSAAMIAKGRDLDGERAPNLSWINGTAEEGPFYPPYGLIVAAQSLHWFDWDRCLPLFGTLLSPGAVLAIVDENECPEPWSESLRNVIPQYSTNPGYRPYDIVSELEQRNLFRVEGRVAIDPEPYVRTVDEYVESFHGRSAFSRAKMTPSAADAFDNHIRAMVQPYVQDGRLPLRAGATIVWGQPLKP